MLAIEYAGTALGTTLLGILLLLLLFGWQFRKFSHVRKLMSAFEGPPAVPIFGNAHLFYDKTPAEVCAVLFGLHDRYGKTVKLWFMQRYSVLMADLCDVEMVLNTLLTKSFEYELLKPWLSDGLLLSSGRKWFKRRKVLTPAFHFSKLETYVDVFDRQSRVLVAQLGKLSGAINLSQWIHLCTLDVICETAMGVSVHAQTNADSEYVRAVKTISTVLHKRMFDLLYRFDYTYMFTSLARDERRALNVLHSFTEKIIVQRRRELLRAQQEKGRTLASPSVNDNDDDIGVKRKMAFLDILLQSKIDDQPLSNLDIREEVDTFMFEGHDTTSSAIMFFFYNIATNALCQRQCIEEIWQVLGKDKATPVTYELLNKLHYVELCIKETLRLFPSVPLLGRKVHEETVINGKTIPAGTNIGISPLHLGRNADLFAEPEAFKPERFDVVTSAEKMNPYAFIPFSAGPRNCIGQKFAMLEIKAIVTNVLRHFEVTPVKDQMEPVLIAELILRTRDPLLFELKERVV